MTDATDRAAAAVLERHGLSVVRAASMTDVELLELRGVGGRMLERIRALAPDDESVVAAVRRDLAAIASRDHELARSALAVSALALARELDRENSATSKSMCARALRETLDRLRELTPVDDADDPVERIAGRARLKLAGGAAA